MNVLYCTEVLRTGRGTCEGPVRTSTGLGAREISSTQDGTSEASHMYCTWYCTQASLSASAAVRRLTWSFDTTPPGLRLEDATPVLPLQPSAWSPSTVLPRPRRYFHDHDAHFLASLARARRISTRTSRGRRTCPPNQSRRSSRDAAGCPGTGCERLSFPFVPCSSRRSWIMG